MAPCSAVCVRVAAAAPRAGAAGSSAQRGFVGIRAPRTFRRLGGLAGVSMFRCLRAKGRPLLIAACGYRDALSGVVWTPRDIRVTDVAAVLSLLCHYKRLLREPLLSSSSRL